MEFKFDEKFRIERFRAHYSDLFPCNIDKHCKAFIKGSLSSVPLDTPILIVDSHDWMRQSFISLFMRKGFVDYKMMSAYKLLDIFLEHDEDTQSLLDVSADVLCFYLGYGEFENKRQGDALIQVINNQAIDRKTVWIYYKGTYESLRGRHPDLCRFFESNKYTIVKPGSGDRLMTVGGEL